MSTVSTSSPLEPKPSLPLRLCETLRREIGVALKPGDKLPSMRGLCEQYSVSINTVGAALDILAAEGLVEKRHGSGVYVTERLGRARIGILSELDLFDTRISPCFRAVAGELKRRLEELGAESRIYIGSAEPGEASDTPTCPEFWEDIAAGRMEAAVLQDTPSTAAWQKRVAECTIPLVGWGTGYSAEIDFSRLMKAAVRHLADQGCRRVGMLAWHNRQPFVDAVRACGMETCEAWIRCDLDPSSRGAGWDQFREIWLGGKGRPDCLVVLDDMLFSDAQLAILELGVRVPDEVRLAVLLNRDASPSVRLPVEAFEINPAEWAGILADMVMARHAGRPIAKGLRALPFVQLSHHLVTTTHEEL